MRIETLKRRLKKADRRRKLRTVAMRLTEARARTLDDRFIPCTSGRRGRCCGAVGEVHRTFTFDGDPIPPEIFGEFGDGDWRIPDPSG